MYKNKLQWLIFTTDELIEYSKKVCLKNISDIVINPSLTGNNNIHTTYHHHNYNDNTIYNDDVLKTSVNSNNNNPFHNDLVNVFDELKEYIIHSPNCEYLIKYNVLNLIAYVTSNILWHKTISLIII